MAGSGLRTAPLVLLALCGCALSGAPAAPGIHIAYFESDATPPLGFPLAAQDRVRVVDAPLLLKGLLLEDGDDRYVIAALDWCTITPYDYAVFRSRLAAAAETTPDRVTVHCTHTHSAPSRRTRDRNFVDRTADKGAAALREARAGLRRVTHVAYGKARVERFASNRRVPHHSRGIVVRWSKTTDGYLRNAPEGKIDPWIRTVSFLDGTVPRVRIHFYASHPQSYYGDGHAHPDVPGWARERLEKEEGIPHIYFTGCAGDITAGKYNDGSPDARAGLIDRLEKGMREAIRASSARSLASLGWSSTPVRFARHAEDQPPGGGRLLPSIDLLRLQAGPVDVVFLPGEPFVEYQLHAQRLRPDRFVAVAGYGNGSPGYICTDEAYGQNGYEQKAAASRVGPPTERILKEALARLLN